MNTSRLYLIFLTIMLLIVFGINKSEAQCNDTLIRQAILESGHDAVFLKEYKVKFKKGKANRPTRVAKYSSFLKDSTTYRFNITNAKEYDGQLILQLYNKGELLGSTYNFEALKYNKSFDFECKNEDSYEILMSFIEGKAGCAAAVLSMVINDSTVIAKPDFPEVLYVGQQNPVYIAYTEEQGCHVHVFSDQGTIEGQNGKYLITPDSVGTLKITAQTIDNQGTIKEEISKEFKVENIPLPHVSINGITGGLINKSDVVNLKQLDIYNYHVSEPDEIISFTVSDKLIGISGKSSENQFFNFSQLNFLKNLQPGDQFYIMNIKIKRANKSVVEIKPLGFIIY